MNIARASNEGDAQEGATLPEIGSATGVPFKSVQRILERASG
jgi:hypothetical protein